MRVWALPDVIEELEDLIDILFEKGYFSYAETSAEYVVSLFEDIIENLPKKLKRKAPKYFTDRYGDGLYYAVFPKSKRTQWYAFFRMYEKDGKLYYQVRYISNNHKDAHRLDISL
jgi:hypothetical protein